MRLKDNDTFVPLSEIPDS